MTNNEDLFASSKKILPFFVFTQNLEYSENSETYDKILEKLDIDLLNGELDKNWLNFWLKEGEEILLYTWSKEYEDYVANSLEMLEIEENILKENQATLETQQIVQEETINNKSTNITWAHLWEEHCQSIEAEQYNIFTQAASNYLYLFKRSIQSLCTPPERKIEKSSSTNSFSSETEKMAKLGLPTGFGARAQGKSKKKKRNGKLKPEQQQEITISNYDSDSEYELDADVDNGENDDKEKEMNLEIEKVKSSEEEEEEEDSNEDALHVTQKNPITEKNAKKRQRHNNAKRRLRNAPKYIQDDKGLIKYWRKRFSLFSRFDDGIQLDRESWFSVTPEKIAIHLAERLACNIIIDGFCGCGGNTIQFAKYCNHVIAIDIDPSKLAMAKHNAEIYGVANKIDFILGDFLELSQNGKFHADAVFLSPPWGGPSYKKKNDYDIEKFLLPVGAQTLLEHARMISNNVALFLPRNANMQQIIKGAGLHNKCEVEYNYLNTRLVALTAFYGDEIIKNKKNEINDDDDNNKEAVAEEEGNKEAVEIN